MNTYPLSIAFYENFKLDFPLLSRDIKTLVEV